MKKLISVLACTVAAVSVLVSCQPKETPDAKCELTAFSIPANLNSALSADIIGTIDASAKTVTLVIPTSVTTNSFIPAFTVTEYDVVTIGGTAVTSGETQVTINDGTKISVKDDVSLLSAEYTVVVKENDDAAELTAVVFKAADNTLLAQDVAPEAIASEMLVRVPGEAFRKELTVTVSAGFNDAIKVNNEAVASGSSIKVDSSFPIDIVVTDEVAGKSASYVLKVGKILEVVVTRLGSYSEGTINDFTMTINPSDNLPYFAYTRKIGDEKNNGVSIAKWTGSAFSLVGTTGLADASARSASKPKVAFDKDGTLYAFYIGGEVASKPTVKKLDSDWVTIGTPGFTEYNNNTTYAYPFYVHPADNKLNYLWCGNTRNQASYRTMNFASSAGSDWTSTIISGSIPAYGANGGNDGMYYTSAAVVSGGKVYIVSSFNQYGYYVHEVNADGSLTAIVQDYKPGTSENGLPANVTIKCGQDGSLYIMGADRSAEAMQIFSVDQDAKTLKPYGAGIHVEISASGGINVDASFGVNPITGLVVAAYDGEENIPVIQYLDDNLQWSPFAVDSPAAASSAYFIEFDKDGNGYLAYKSADGIELYKVAFEADILPE